jgi:HAE1 family hydrophobic/amphiphilic exporter-1
VTGNVSNAIASLAKAWPGKNLTIVQSGVGTQLTDGFVNMAYAVQVAIGLVYLLLVIFFALPLVVITGFVSLATTGRALDLSTLIGLLMLRGIVVTNAVVLLTLVQHKIETSDDVRTVLVQGGRTGVRSILMTAAATMLALLPLVLSSGGLIAASLATDWEGSGAMKGPLAAEPTNVQCYCPPCDRRRQTQNHRNGVNPGQPRRLQGARPKWSHVRRARKVRH